MLKSFERKITLFEGAIRDSQVFSPEEVNSELKQSSFLVAYYQLWG